MCIFEYEEFDKDNTAHRQDSHLRILAQQQPMWYHSYQYTFRHTSETVRHTNQNVYVLFGVHTILPLSL